MLTNEVVVLLRGCGTFARRYPLWLDALELFFRPTYSAVQKVQIFSSQVFYAVSEQAFKKKKKDK